MWYTMTDTDLTEDVVTRFEMLRAKAIRESAPAASHYLHTGDWMQEVVTVIVDVDTGRALGFWHGPGPYLSHYGIFG